MSDEPSAAYAAIYEAAQALEEVKVASDTGGNLMFVLKFNPTWAEQAAPRTA